MTRMVKLNNERFVGSVSTHMCRHICECIHTYIYIDRHICARTPACVHGWVGVHVCARVRACMHACVCVYVRAHVHACGCPCRCVRVSHIHYYFIKMIVSSPWFIWLWYKIFTKYSKVDQKHWLFIHLY